MGFGIPTTQSEFAEAERSGRSDYVKLWLGGSLQFRRKLLPDIEHFRRRAQQWSLNMAPSLRLADLTVLCEQFPIVVLFSHFDADHVEFSDGFFPSEHVLGAVPIRFTGVLDLCVCHPDSLVQKLDTHRPCLVKWTPKVAAPAYWLMFYEVLFSALFSGALTYLDALEAVTKAFREDLI